MVYMNTNVTRGAGEFVVTTTGMATEVGHISGMLAQESDEDSPLTRQLAKLTTQILVISGVAVVISIILNLSRGEAFNDGLPGRDRVRDLRDPDRAAGGRDDDPLDGHADARARRTRS